MALDDSIRFCTAADVKAVSTVHPAFAGLDDRIDNWARIATGQVIEACNREFVYQEGIEEYFGTPDRHSEEFGLRRYEPYRIWLKEPNVVLSSLQVFLSYRYEFVDNSLLVRGINDGERRVSDNRPQDYYIEKSRVNPELIGIVFTRRLQYHERSLKVVYNAGYKPVETPTQGGQPDKTLIDVPTSLVRATAIQAGFLMSRAGNEDIGTGDVRREGLMRRDPRITPEGVTGEARFLLRRWRRSLTDSM